MFSGVGNIIQIRASGGVGVGFVLVSGWFDFNGDGDWVDAGELAINNANILPGNPGNPVNFVINVPAGASPGITYARFRVSTNGVQGGHLGEATDGEVEDYALRICPPPPPPTCCVHLSLLIDRSSSMRGGPLAQAVGAAIDLVNLMNMPPSLIEVISFHTTTTTNQPFTADKAKVIAALNALAVGDSTIMAPAIDTAQADLTASHVAGCEDIMIIVSDGGAKDWPAALLSATAAKAAGTRIIVVGILVAAADVANMTSIASAPSDAYFASTPEQLRDIFFQLRWKICGATPPPPCRPPYGPEQSPYDLGDAPDSSNHFGAQMTTYGGAVAAGFPTVFDVLTGVAQGPRHTAPPADIFLGGGVSLEGDADRLPDQDFVPNIDPPKNKGDQDWADDGVQFPIALPSCMLTTFQYDVTVVAGPSTRFVNAWLDINRDGDWADTIGCFDPERGAVYVAEWAVQNQVLSLAPGLHTVQTPQFNYYDPAGTNAPTWLRVTVSDVVAPSPQDGRGPANGYGVGETEDFLLDYDAESGGYGSGSG